MILEWVKTIGPILLSWPVVLLVVILLFRKSILAFFKDVTAKDIKMFKVGTAGFEFERVVKQVEERQDRQDQEINAIKFALEGLLTKQERRLLKALLVEPEFIMRWEPDTYIYLHRLDGLDFIQPNKSVEKGLFQIEEDHRNEFSIPPEERPRWDLKHYVYITEKGRTYLNTLEGLGIEIE
jgi:hypothetical protein